MEDVAPPQLCIRRIGWLERQLRMRWRVFCVAIGLPRAERRSAGLTVWRALRDLEGAYRDANSFHVRQSFEHYGDWVERTAVLGKEDVVAIRTRISRLATRPRFRVLILAAGERGDGLRATIASLQAQIYDEYEYQVIERADEADFDDRLRAFNASVADAGPHAWMMMLEAGETLAPHALYWFAHETLQQRTPSIVYSDDDGIDERGARCAPRFKPDWSPALFQAHDYVGHAAVVSAAAATRAGGLGPTCRTRGAYDLLLRVVEADAGLVRHIAAPLLHRPEGMPAPPEVRRIRHRLPDPLPAVSIVVPTRDAVALLRRCVESVLQATSYPNFELLVVDNGSADADALEYLAEIAKRPRVRVLRYPKPFNYSAINNWAAREAAGELLCLLNNDTEVISADWLEEMAGHLLQPGVGAVGAKLYYPDGRVQHGGVTVGPGGGAHHLHVGLRRDEPGYCGLAGAARECSAVTAACLLTWSHLYRDLGGLNERWLPVTFNDVDYCLRLLEAGRRVIYTPHAELYHHESATRGMDSGDWRKVLRVSVELQYMRARWGRRMTHDPYYNPNFSYRRPDFSLSETQRVRRPWR